MRSRRGRPAIGDASTFIDRLLPLSADRRGAAEVRAHRIARGDVRAIRTGRAPCGGDLPAAATRCRRPHHRRERDVGHRPKICRQDPGADWRLDQHASWFQTVPCLYARQHCSRFCSADHRPQLRDGLRNSGKAGALTCSSRDQSQTPSVRVAGAASVLACVAAYAHSRRVDHRKEAFVAARLILSMAGAQKRVAIIIAAVRTNERGRFAADRARPHGRHIADG